MKICPLCQTKFAHSGWDCPSCHQSPIKIDGHLSFAPELAKQNDGFEANIFAELAPLEAKNFWFCARNRLIVWSLKKFFPKAERFLEIGCGTGFVLQEIEKTFPQLDLYGSEIYSEGLSFAAKRLHRTQLFQMDGCNIPFKNHFDVIGAFDVLEHIQTDQEVLDQMYFATSKQGGIILTVPQHPWLWSQADEYAHHVRRYEVQDLTQKVKKAGFTIVKVTSFVSLLLPLMVLSRSQQKNNQEQYNIKSELQISPFLNLVLEKMLNIERVMIQIGTSFPWGGSLLVIAKK